MSIKAMLLVFYADIPDLKTSSNKSVKASTIKLVALAMADHCNSEGEGIYPGNDKLAKKTSLSERTIIKTKDAMTQANLLKEMGWSKLNTKKYNINLDLLEKLQYSDVGMNPVHPKYEPRSVEGVNPVHPNRPLKQKETYANMQNLINI